MTGKMRYHERGSAVIMAVGLLVILGLLGTTFYVITKLDRNEAESLATAAPMKNVAAGVLEQICAERVKDLHLDSAGRVYGGAGISTQTYDAPHETVDKALACVRPINFLWRHVSNLPGDLAGAGDGIWVDGTILTGPFAGKYVSELVDVNGNQLHDWVDTDGTAFEVPPGSGKWYDGDAILYDSGLRDRVGHKFYVAVRVIDAGALLNVNLAYDPAPARPGVVMPVTDVSLKRLLEALGDPSPQVTVDKIHAGTANPLTYGRRGATGDSVLEYWWNYALRPLNIGPDAPSDPRAYLPFDLGDMLALAWGGYMPNAGSGRLWRALNEATIYEAAKPYLTTHSTSRILLPRSGLGGVRADLNKTGFSTLLTAFTDMIPLGIKGLSDTRFVRAVTATRLALNVIDFRDDDQVPTARSVADNGNSVLVCGIERQPFITEAAYTLHATGTDTDGNLIVESYYAVELFNPYVTPISTAGWKIQIGTDDPPVRVDFPVNPMPAYSSAQPNTSGRVVIVNRSDEIKVTDTAHVRPELDLSQEVRILRPTTAPGEMVVVGRIVPQRDFNGVARPVSVPEKTFKCIRRCDNLTNALYSVRLYKSFAEDITAVPITSNLGLASGVSVRVDDFRDAGNRPPAPTPVYVRNNDFVNVGELSRIFLIGPTANEGIDEQLAGMDVYDVSNGRLSISTPIPDPPAPPQDVHGPYRQRKIPAVPLACMLGDFFMVHSPHADGVDNDADGKIDAADNDGGEDVLFGQININAATEEVLMCLPGLAGLPADVRAKIVQEVIAYRDLLDNSGPYDPQTGKGLGANYSPGRQDATVGIPNLRREPGFATAGEIAIPILLRGRKGDIPAGWQLPQNRYVGANLEPLNYTVSEDTPFGLTHDDGLRVQGGDRVDGDLIKYLTYFGWLSNHVAARSDAFIAYIRVDLRASAAAQPLAVRKYVALIDRSNCRASADRPNVLMFAEIK